MRSRSCGTTTAKLAGVHSGLVERDLSAQSAVLIGGQLIQLVLENFGLHFRVQSHDPPTEGSDVSFAETVTVKKDVIVDGKVEVVEKPVAVKPGESIDVGPSITRVLGSRAPSALGCASGRITSVTLPSSAVASNFSVLVIFKFAPTADDIDNGLTITAISKKLTTISGTDLPAEMVVENGQIKLEL